MELTRKNVESLNSLLLMIYMYLSTLTIPFKEIFNSGAPVWIVTGLIIFISLFINRYNFNIKVLCLLFTIILIFVINLMIFDFRQEALSIFIEFVKFGVLPLYLGSMINNYDTLLRKWYIMGIVNVIIWIIFFESVNSRDLNYMTFGRHMTLSFIIFTVFYYKYGKKLVNLLLLILTLSLIVLVANRSSLLICVAVFICFEIRSLKGKNIVAGYFKSITYISGALFLVIKLESIVVWLRDFTMSLGINSYTLTKAVYAIRQGLIESSSGRDDLLEYSINIIQANNYLPNGIGYFQAVTDIVYPHNFILDILVSFGAIGLLVFLIMLGYSILQYLKIKDESLKIIILSLFIYVFIRLTFSGTFWSEEQLWILIGIMLSRTETVTSYKLSKARLMNYHN